MAGSDPEQEIEMRLRREEIEVLVDDGFPIPEHEQATFDSAQARLRAALEQEERGHARNTE